MNQNDHDDFCKLLSAALSIWGDAPNGELIAIWFRALAEYDLPTVTRGFNAHMQDPANGKYAPKPAHIIEQIRKAQADDGRPSADEAWALSVKARDENQTVVWTHECAQAWGIAKPVMDLGDDVGARMAFRDAYNRLVAAARARREPVQYDVSEGFDPALRRLAIAEAVDAGRIAPGRHDALKQPEKLLGISMDGMDARSIPPHIRQRLQELRSLFTQPNGGSSAADLQREHTAKLKREQQTKAAQYAQKQKAAGRGA